MLTFHPAFHSPLSPSSRVSLVPLNILHKGGVICISEVIDISPGNLDSTLCFIQPGISQTYSTYKLNNHGDNVQPWHTPLPILNQSVVPRPVLTCFLTCIQVSQKAGKVVWYSHLFKNFPQFVVIQTVKVSSIINKAEIDVFLEFSWFFYNSMDVGNLISDSSAFSESSLYIWKFSVHVLLKPSLTDFEHYLASMCCCCC